MGRFVCDSGLLGPYSKINFLLVLKTIVPHVLTEKQNLKPMYILYTWNHGKSMMRIT